MLWGGRPPFLSQSLIPGLVPVMGLIETKSSQSTAKDLKGPFWLLSLLWRQQVQVLCALCVQLVCDVGGSSFLASQQNTVRFCSTAGPLLLSDWLSCELQASCPTCCWVSLLPLLPVGCWDRCTLLGSTFLYGLWGSDSGYRPCVASAFLTRAII